MDGKVVIYKRADGLWDWRLVAANGEIVGTSGGQGYTERGDAVEAVSRVFGADYHIELQT
jgi:uncharacterized protein YegP (UPF0339 family)